MKNSLEFFKLLSGELAPEKLLIKFLMLLLQLQNVERGSIWVRKEEGHVCVEAAGADSEDIKGMCVPVSRASIVGWVMENGRMTISEPAKDERHYSEVERDMAVKSRLILGFPLFLRNGTVYGVVEIIDTSAGGDKMNLDEQYLELLQNLVDLGSIALSNSIEFKDLGRENSELKHTLELICERSLVTGPSEPFNKILELARGYARTDYPVLITGESGTGKELVARDIHERSRRKGKPFLAQNCSAIPSSLLASELFGYKKGAFTGAYRDKVGLFEAAKGGTVFLDEIGDMSHNLQATLLRVLQDNEIKPLGSTAARKVDVRIIAATNKDLQQAIADGEFREDLFFRLNVLPLALPPLCRRVEDIPYLLAHFIKREATCLETSPKILDREAMALVMGYAWPGNVRELENFVKQVMVSTPGRTITPDDLPPHIASGEPAVPDAARPDPYLNRTWEEVERNYILSLLERNRWVITHAARAAGLKRSTFDSRMKRLGIRKSA